MNPSLTAALTAIVMLGATACAPMQEVTTEIRVRDPSAVALTRPDGAVVVPATRSPAEAPLDQGRVDTGPGGSAAYAVQGRREDDRSLAVGWTTTLPLSNGDRHTVLPSNGAITLKKPAEAIVTQDMLAAPHLKLAWCTTLKGHSARGVVGYSVEPLGCLDDAETESAFSHGTAAVPYVLDVPWPDVIEVRGRTRPDHGSAWLIVALSTLTFGTIATMVFGFRSSSFTGGAPTKIALGVVSVGAGLAFDLAMLPTLIARDRDVVLYPSAP